ncbi:MAG: HAMP domain-containing protein [Alphaproteobacteria bacterium]|nr:HAMP domain-containing protein [Alphaproteobacteria bacterium]MBQ9234972.1 HAMP domain-containing protein [Alphaproteobacteria bacterium]
MFISLNRKIIYLIFTLLISSCALFIYTFYTTYSLKIEKDQQTSIQRNQQYNELLMHNINLSKDLKYFISQNPNLKINSGDYQYLSSFLDDSNANFLVKEQKNIAERTRQFNEQYQIINRGVIVIAFSTVVQIIFLLIMGWLINRLILIPINKISAISERIAKGDLSLRIPLRQNARLIDELDRLSETFNTMLDNLQHMMQKIKEEENFLQSIIDSIPDGIRVIDDHYNIIIANKSYYAISGDTSQRLGKCYASSFGINNPCNSPQLKCPVCEILQKQATKTNTIQQFAHQPNRYLAVNAAPLIYDANHRCIIESIRDLSQDIDFSHQQKVSSLGFLSSSIAHEIKNQLGALRIITEHLMSKYFNNKPDDAEDKKLITMIYNEIVNATQVPERLLKLTRNYDMISTSFDCCASVSDTISLLDYEAKIHGVEIELDIPAKEIILQGNETDFKIATINIILNAIKAMPHKGLLKIKITSSPKSGIKISFTDNGSGIAKENLSRIFNPFFSHGNQNVSSQGTGLGLSITKSIIEKQGGTIDVKSTLGKGSCFTFIFPVQKHLQNPKQTIIKNTKNNKGTNK